ncbi:MAG: N-carbamoylputrescine amidase, partial [Lachnospiraceae bacterium]|nr:N-carbamoylputrescine amidase [Lachnospiraceae bacterium]
MRKVNVAAIQMQCSTSVEENILKAKEKIKEAAKNGAQIVLLPELFERQYFCQERRYEYYSFAKTVNENDAVYELAPLAKELGVVLPLSI